MKIALFYHSLISDWNHGNAHFLRGVASELINLGHEVLVLEPRGAWSYENLIAAHGRDPIRAFQSAYPQLTSIRYDPRRLDLDRLLDGVDLVLVHEWNEPEIVALIGAHRALNRGYHLLFHDTHHRTVTAPEQMARYDLSQYGGVLAFGSLLRDLYLSRGWAQNAWTWHEAADTRLFRPIPRASRPPQNGRSESKQRWEELDEGDLVWIGNWGDDERTAELHEFLVEPVRELGLRARLHGVRYPASARKALAAAEIEYGGWLPNFRVPEVFARYRVTVHVPRRPYTRSLPGIPTIRVFEALACGIPLVCAPWVDSEGLFSPDCDFLIAENGSMMRRHLKALLNEPAMARELAQHGLATIQRSHTCAHRARELLDIAHTL